jgi:hypothetical protein
MVTMFPPVLQLQPECSQERPVHKPHTLTDFTDSEEVIGDERSGGDFRADAMIHRSRRMWFSDLL